MWPNPSRYKPVTCMYMPLAVKKLSIFFFIYLYHFNFQQIIKHLYEDKKSCLQYFWWKWKMNILMVSLIKTPSCLNFRINSVWKLCALRYQYGVRNINGELWERVITESVGLNSDKPRTQHCNNLKLHCFRISHTMRAELHGFFQGIFKRLKHHLSRVIALCMCG